MFVATTSGTGRAIIANSTSGPGVQSNTTTGSAFFANGTSGIGYNASVSGTGIGANLLVANGPVLIGDAVTTTSTNTVVEEVSITRRSTSMPTLGIGQSWGFYLGDTIGQTAIANQLISKWSTISPVYARVSQFDITGVNAGTVETFANFQTGGIVRVNNLADTLATRAYARANGGGGGGGTTDSSIFATRYWVQSLADSIYLRTPGSGVNSIPFAYVNGGALVIPKAKPGSAITFSVSGVDSTWTIGLTDMPAHTIKGNNTSLSGAPLDLTAAQVTAELGLFTTSLQGVVPSSPGGTSAFLRADGTWTNPGATPGGSTFDLQWNLNSVMTGGYATIDTTNKRVSLAFNKAVEGGFIASNTNAAAGSVASIQANNGSQTTKIAQFTSGTVAYAMMNALSGNLYSNATTLNIFADNALGRVRIGAGAANANPAMIFTDLKIKADKRYLQTGTSGDSVMVYNATDSSFYLVSQASITSGVSGDYSVASASSSAAYTITTANYIILPDLSATASHSVTLPSTSAGKRIVLKNNNPNTSAFTWFFAGRTVKDFANNTVTTIPNLTVIQLVDDGTNYNIIN